MRDSKLKERLGRLGPSQAVNRLTYGSRVVIVMRPKSDLSEVKTITATKALAKRGMTMLRAKRAVETMIDKGEAVIEVPIVEDVMTFYDDLAKAGISANRIASEPLDLQAVRVGLGLTQEQFARRYNLALDAIQNWERGVRTPDRSMQSYLRVIAAYPDIAARAQEQNNDKECS